MNRSANSVSNPDLTQHIVINLSKRFQLAAFLLIIGFGTDIPWLDKNPAVIISIRGALIAGSFFSAFLCRFCQTRMKAEILVVTGILIEVYGLAMLGVVEGNYFTGYIAAIYQTLAFLTVFIPLRRTVFAILISLAGLLWFLVIPVMYRLNFDQRLYLSHFAGYITSGFISLIGNQFFLRLRLEEERQRTELELQTQHLQELATRDGLTGVFNFRHFQEILSASINDAQGRNKPLSLCLIDLDDFKIVNDEDGHVAGNTILKHVAKCLQSVVRHDDLVFRIGGDEFAIILPGTRANDAKMIGERIHSILDSEKTPLDDEYAKTIVRPVQCSLGIAELSSAWSTPLTFIEAADRALYRAKQDPRRIVIANELDAE
jgi:diguanylate cyclase (GGDEF)-like protein